MMLSRIKKNLTDGGRLDTTRALQILSLVTVFWMMLFIAFIIISVMIDSIIHGKLPDMQTLKPLGNFIAVGFGPTGVVCGLFSALYQYKRKVKNGTK